MLSFSFFKNCIFSSSKIYFLFKISKSNFLLIVLYVDFKSIYMIEYLSIFLYFLISLVKSSMFKWVPHPGTKLV